MAPVYAPCRHQRARAPSRPGSRPRRRCASGMDAPWVHPAEGRSGTPRPRTGAAPQRRARRTPSRRTPRRRRAPPPLRTRTVGGHDRRTRAGARGRLLVVPQAHRVPEGAAQRARVPPRADPQLADLTGWRFAALPVARRSARVNACLDAARGRHSSDTSSFTRFVAASYWRRLSHARRMNAVTARLNSSGSSM